LPHMATAAMALQSDGKRTTARQWEFAPGPIGWPYMRNREEEACGCGAEDGSGRGGWKPWGTRKGGGEREGGRTGRIEDRGEQFRNLRVQKSGLPCFSAMAEVGKARNGVGRTNE
jgi:hypothetical protein